MCAQRQCPAGAPAGAGPTEVAVARLRCQVARQHQSAIPQRCRHPQLVGIDASPSQLVRLQGRGGREQWRQGWTASWPLGVSRNSLCRTCLASGSAKICSGQSDSSRALMRIAIPGAGLAYLLQDAQAQVAQSNVHFLSAVHLPAVGLLETLAYPLPILPPVVVGWDAGAGLSRGSPTARTHRPWRLAAGRWQRRAGGSNPACAVTLHALRAHCAGVCRCPTAQTRAPRSSPCWCGSLAATQAGHVPKPQSAAPPSSTAGIVRASQVVLLCCGFVSVLAAEACHLAPSPSNRCSDRSDLPVPAVINASRQTRACNSRRPLGVAPRTRTSCASRPPPPNASWLSEGFIQWALAGAGSCAV